MVLVGYHFTGGYKLQDPKHKKIVINRDVMLDESKRWDQNTKIDKCSIKMLIDLNNANKVETSTSAATGLRRSTKTKQIP